MTGKKLVTAATQEWECEIPRGSAYRMAERGVIPAYMTGPKQSGIRFQIDEVLDALRRPVKSER